MDRGAWCAGVHEVAKSRTWQSNWTELKEYISPFSKSSIQSRGNFQYTVLKKHFTKLHFVLRWHSSGEAHWSKKMTNILEKNNKRKTPWAQDLCTRLWLRSTLSTFGLYFCYCYLEIPDNFWRRSLTLPSFTAPFKSFNQSWGQTEKMLKSLPSCAWSFQIYDWHLSFPVGTRGKEPTCQCRRHRLDRCIGKTPWSRAWQPIPVFFAWRTSWTEKSGGLQSIGLRRTWLKWLSTHTWLASMIGELYLDRERICQ